jgi:hypothetical protein
LEREAGDAPPPVPEKFAAALDMTAEIPKVHPDSESATSTVAARASGAPAPYVGTPAPETRQRYADETMELPIFRELESAWFNTQRSVPGNVTVTAPDEVRAGVTIAPDSRVSDRQQGMMTGTMGSTAMANTPTTGESGRARGPVPEVPDAGPAEPLVSSWQTAADDGWRAAAAAADVTPTETTGAGLPKRVPMSQLVPGGVDKGANTMQRRTPEAVRGLLSAYHRGVQRGRSQPKDETSTNPEPTSVLGPDGMSRTGNAGQQSPQAGKEHES